MAVARQYPVRQIAEFGSLVHGELKAECNIDFVVDCEAPCKLRDHICPGTSGKTALVGMESVMGTKMEPRKRFSCDLFAGWGI